MNVDESSASPHGTPKPADSRSCFGRESPARLDLVETRSIPALAWAACISRGTPTATVFHGSRVEPLPNGFIEGAWDGPFGAMHCDSTTIVCGSGGIVENGMLRFFASTDRLIPIFSVPLQNRLIVSNSAIFALSMAGLEPHPTYPFYGYDLNRIWRAGEYSLSGKLRTNGTASLRIHFSALMTVGPGLITTFSTFPLAREPVDFESYRELLTVGVDRIISNARDPKRTSPLLPMATASRGYDSTATAVLAKEAGCTEAFALRNSRSNDPALDSGAEIARKLGMTVEEIDRWDYLHLDPPCEPEFCFYPVSNNIPLAPLRRSLAGRILVTGHSGNQLWESRRAVTTDRSASPYRRAVIGASLQEFRLNTGFAVFAPAMIAAAHGRAIAAISDSASMSAWSIGGDYDRPIPRRIAEEAGVPRRAFGITELGFGSASVALNRPEHFSSAARDLFDDFVRIIASQNHRFSARTWRTAAAVRHSGWRSLDKISGAFGCRHRARHVPSTPAQRAFPFLLNARPLPIPWPYGLTFQWAFHHLRDRYRDAGSSS